VGKGPGGVIVAVEPGSLAEQIGLKPGDQLIAINDHLLRDLIDVQFYGAEESLELLVTAFPLSIRPLMWTSGAAPTIVISALSNRTRAVCAAPSISKMTIIATRSSLEIS
jgi:membrane-associated protease RseP (regulator of RpoE activity)